MTYKGKVDWWIGVALLSVIAFPAFTAIQRHNYWLLAISAGTALFVLIFSYPQKYEIEGDALYLRAGLTTRVISWSAITSVSDSSDSRSGLAMSLDRVLIQYAGGDVLVVPDGKVRFFDDVAAHCPQLSWRGMDLVIALN